MKSVMASSLIADPKLRAQINHFWTPNPYEVINVCYFKLQVLWQFCDAATYN